MTPMRLILCIFVLTVPQQLLAVVPGNSGWPSTMLLIDHTMIYMFRADNDYCFGTEGDSTDNNAKIVMSGRMYNNLYSLQWKAWTIQKHPKKFTLVNQNSPYYQNMCLTMGIDLYDTGNNVPLVQYQCQEPPPDTQLWSYELITDNDQHWIRLRGSGNKCVSYDLSNPLNGALYAYDCGCCDRYHNQYFEPLYVGRK